MKTLSLTALFAAVLFANTAEAQFGNDNGFNNQQNFNGQSRQRGRRQSRITPELIAGIIGLFDDSPRNNVQTVSITGTWNETLNGFQLQHTMSPGGFHQIIDRRNGNITNSHQAGFDGTNLQLLNGRYSVAEVSPGVLQLRNSRETRTWVRSNGSGIGNGGGINDGSGTVVPPIQNTGVPQQLQGFWYAVSPENTRWMFVIRANNYDMFDIDPTTGRPVMDNGQPIQLVNDSLTFNNGVLDLSPGQDVNDGPFNTQAAPDASQLFLTPINGAAPVMLTRFPQN